MESEREKGKEGEEGIESMSVERMDADWCAYQHGMWMGLKGISEVMENLERSNGKNKKNWSCLKSFIDACLMNRMVLEEFKDLGGDVEIWINIENNKVSKVGKIEIKEE